MSDITIICTRERGLHRGGVFHPSGAKTWPLEQFTSEQLAEIKEDRRLMVKEEHSPSETVEEAIKDVVDILRPFVDVTEQVITETIAELVAKKQATEEKEDDSVDGDGEVTPDPILPRSRKRGTRNAQ